MQTDVNTLMPETITYSKFQSFIKLSKVKLSALVVFSAVITFLTVAKSPSWQQVLAIFIGGFLVTAGANGFNQIIERDLDKLMTRTRLRPMPTGNLTVNEALIFCAICGIVGTVLLWIYTNPLSGIIGFCSIILYAFVYTPLKRVTPFSVFVGAFPGAFPTLIGAVAASPNFGSISFFAILLFLIQFFWQFPHFWAIAWVSHDDYQKAGFFMLPSKGGRDKTSKSQILIYTLALFPISLTPYFFEFAGWFSASVAATLGIVFINQAYQLYKTSSIADARKLMFGSFYYLPVVQLALMIDCKFIH